MNLLGLLRPSEQLNFPGTQSRAAGFAKNKYALNRWRELGNGRGI